MRICFATSEFTYPLNCNQCLFVPDQLSHHIWNRDPLNIVDARVPPRACGYRMAT
jgi:hypothetical protein